MKKTDITLLIILAFCFGCLVLVISKVAMAVKLSGVAVEAADSWIEAVERWPDAQGYITDNFGRTTPMNTWNRQEPNEPMKLKFGGDNMTWSIPTWPDFIELEKDLWFDMTSLNDPNSYVLYDKIGFPKGTKIYFKD